MAEPASCTRLFSFADFFKDTPWLNVPSERQAVFIAPLYPRVGLLGGSSDGAPKMSKLQALAAARKKKAQEQKSGRSDVEKPMSDLSINGGPKEETTVDPAAKQPSRGFPLRKRKDSNPHEKSLKTPSPKSDAGMTDPDTQMEIAPISQAEPSAFASTMFSSPVPSAPSASLFTLPYTAATTAATDPFAGPSPDDVVMAAQSKGSTISASKQAK